MAQEQPPIRLRDMGAPEALSIVATWLEDCEDHLALHRTGDLPTPPFSFADAWVAVRQAGLRICLPPGDAA